MGRDFVADLGGDLKRELARGASGPQRLAQVMPETIGQRAKRGGIRRALHDFQHVGRMPDGGQADRKMNQKPKGIPADIRVGEEVMEFFEVVRVIGLGHGRHIQTTIQPGELLHV